MDIIGEEVIDFCAADFDVRYALAVYGSDIYVAYYGGEHDLRMARRNGAGRWEYAVLPEKVNWDSHKYVTMAIDAAGHIHLCANMHCEPLVYYRSERPGDIFSMKKQAMTDLLEDSVTYPEFLKSGDRLVFHYREGRSGNGNTYLNIYDTENAKWEKLTERPLFNGMGVSNSYFKGPVADKNGRFHLLWCWRDNADCLSNHGLYYASSSDLINWESPSGFTKELPITPTDDGFLVDDIKTCQGLINGGFAIADDCGDAGSPAIAYHKYDHEGNTNLYLATFADGRCEKRRLTDWHWRWNFSGKGSIPFLLEIVGARQENGVVNVEIARHTRRRFYSTLRMNSFLITTDLKSGNTVETQFEPLPERLLKPLRRGMLVHNEVDRPTMLEGKFPRYVLNYSTVFPARDRNRNAGFRPSPLRLVELGERC